jgi:hypothetical protein
MKHLSNFEQYNESRLGKLAAGAAIVGATLYGANAIMNPRTNVEAEYQETELAHFPEFYVRTLGMDENIKVSVNEIDGVIACKTHRGKHADYTITIEEGIDVVYWDISSFGEYIYATTNKSNLPGGEKINISDLEVVKETDKYKILDCSSFFGGPDAIFVNKGYSNPKNEFEMNGKKYTYTEISLGFVSGYKSFVIKCK